MARLLDKEFNEQFLLSEQLRRRRMVTGPQQAAPPVAHQVPSQVRSQQLLPRTQFPVEDPTNKNWYGSQPHAIGQAMGNHEESYLDSFRNNSDGYPMASGDALPGSLPGSHNQCDEADSNDDTEQIEAFLNSGSSRKMKEQEEANMKRTMEQIKEAKEEVLDMMRQLAETTALLAKNTVETAAAVSAVRAGTVTGASSGTQIKQEV